MTAIAPTRNCCYAGCRILGASEVCAQDPGKALRFKPPAKATASNQTGCILNLSNALNSQEDSSRVRTHTHTHTQSHTHRQVSVDSATFAMTLGDLIWQPEFAWNGAPSKQASIGSPRPSLGLLTAIAQAYSEQPEHSRTRHVSSQMRRIEKAAPQQSLSIHFARHWILRDLRAAVTRRVHCSTWRPPSAARTQHRTLGKGLPSKCKAAPEGISARAQDKILQNRKSTPTSCREHQTLHAWPAPNLLSEIGCRSAFSTHL